MAHRFAADARAAYIGDFANVVKEPERAATRTSGIRSRPSGERGIRRVAKGCGYDRGWWFAPNAALPLYDQCIGLQIERLVHAMMLDAHAISLVDEVEAQGVFVELDFTKQLGA